MKKQLLLLVMILLPMATMAYDIAIPNASGVTIYYNYINNGTELEVTYGATNYNSYNGVVSIPEEVVYLNRTRKVTNIGESAFYGCRDLTSITIPNSVIGIGDKAFWECSSLSSITIPNNVANIGKEAFYACSGLTSITIPNNVANIGKGAFCACSGLTSITIPNNVTTIFL